MDPHPKSPVRLSTIKLTNRFYPGESFSRNICKNCKKKFGECTGDQSMCKLATGRRSIPIRKYREWLNHAFPEHKKTVKGRKT